MHRFIQFNDETIDSLLYMELVDLAKTLSQNGEMEVKYEPYSYLDLKNHHVYVSHFWDHRKQEDKVNGLKSDIYLRSIGNYFYSDTEEIVRYLTKVKSTMIPSFAKQLFVIGEDLRLEEICKKLRPGTKRSFEIRRRIFRQYFSTQLNVNLVKSVIPDALFNSMFMLLNAQTPLEKEPNITGEIDSAMPFLKSSLMRFYDTKSSTDVSKICLEMVDVLNEILSRDMLNEYFHLPEDVYFENEPDITFEDLKRKDPLKNNDLLDDEPDGKEEYMDEEFKTWHRETSDSGDSFLQFDLNQGSQSNLMGEGLREGDEGDQALGMVQGSSQQTPKEDYSNMEARQQEKEEKRKDGTEQYGKENRYASPIFLKTDQPSLGEKRQYQLLKGLISPYQKKLKKMIEKTLEHKKVQPRTDLHFGRLNKNLLRFILEENPRMFYKKQNPSHEIDAVFSLLVDCSASMYDKMEQTKKGITLFHESLKSVRVPHEIIGFWEDTNEATKTYHPNYFKPVMDFSNSLRLDHGAEIMQLHPEEDNRDGLAIRIMTERLLNRSENQKFLLVFSDGEPAAMGYEQNGIVDTHEAVLDARKQGIEVINVFLANGEIEESQRNIIQNIYGKFSILVSDIEELPDVLFPLLRRLLYKSL
ncbi:nitric oxide reductase activation protein [Bacillus pakistanensis]|uniref:Nitric oxide reductase activation protein n=1 Tax=Rossellomorea pakistanensis TaxID=992288 RepID=A0ABS2N8E2_9BACI|nr:VWA domain-containing protein [Bacillus pakistanensis]MBM7584121.1 nitric oxide reductase activation protein [Bacillus pakistanensis]